jgi:hypothetical protein
MCMYIWRDEEKDTERERESLKNQRERCGRLLVFFFSKKIRVGVGEGVPLALTTLICEQTDLVFNILVSIYIIYI